MTGLGPPNTFNNHVDKMLRGIVGADRDKAGAGRNWCPIPPTPMDLIHLADAVYEDTKKVTVPTGVKAAGTRQWEMVGGPVVKPYGFYAAHYQSDGQHVLAFRGSDEFVEDWLRNNTKIARGIMPPQVTPAIAQAGKTPKDAYLTGHSLGGALAAVAAARVKRPAVTFSAPGMYTEFSDHFRVCFTYSRIRNYAVRGDPVAMKATTGRQIGGREPALSDEACLSNDDDIECPGGRAGLACEIESRMPPTFHEVMRCRHERKTIINEFKEDSKMYEPLNL